MITFHGRRSDAVAVGRAAQSSHLCEGTEPAQTAASWLGRASGGLLQRQSVLQAAPSMPQVCPKRPKLRPAWVMQFAAWGACMHAGR